MRSCAILARIVAILAVKEHVAPVIVSIVGEEWALINGVASVHIELIRIIRIPLALEAFGYVLLATDGT